MIGNSKHNFLKILQIDLLQFLNLKLTYFWKNFIQKINSDLRIVFLDSGSQWILKELTPRAKKAISHDHYYIGVLLSRQTKLIIEVEKLIFPTASQSESALLQLMITLVGRGRFRSIICQN